ncbi:MAG TPA: TlyA family RNA methyltransferase [Alphaproteobacteria bacterium]|nr:TlyA family RNA methyltransferase [Alphaproteobacteria bacterium]
MSARQRLDVALEARGLLPSRARARDAIRRRTVTVNGTVAEKPGLLVAEGDVLALDDPAAGYVSRAALKLIAGLDAGQIGVEGKTCLDVGASTGGFTQVLLERGAAKVYAVDVGHGQLHPTIAADPRVVPREGLNARELTTAHVPGPIDLVVCDVSFVSVTKVLAPALALCRPGAEAAVLVKPQFEAGREHVGKGGIVTDAGAIERAADAVTAFMEAQGWQYRLAVPSPIAGGDGNREIVALFRRRQTRDPDDPPSRQG